MEKKSKIILTKRIKHRQQQILQRQLQPQQILQLIQQQIQQLIQLQLHQHLLMMK